jgi:WD40 repeat protein
LNLRSFISSEDESGIAVYCCASRSIELKVDTLQCGVRSFSVDPSGTYLAAVTLDGTLLVHRLLSEQGPVRRQHQGYDMLLVKSGAVTKDLCRDSTRAFSVVFQPAAPCPSSSGDEAQVVLLPLSTQLAVSHQDGAPLLFSRDQQQPSHEWSERHFFATAEDSEVTHSGRDVHCVAFSPNGHYLASADVTGCVLVWALRGLDGKGASESRVDALKMLRLEEGGALQHLAL